MKKIKFRVKSLLSVGLMALLVTCMVASLIVAPAFADADGYALRFHGTSDYVELPQTRIVFGNEDAWKSSKSVALWVKPDGPQITCADPNFPSIVDCPVIFGDYPTFWGISIGNVEGTVPNRIWVWNYDTGATNSFAYVGIDYTPGVWVHIAMVHSGNELRAYKNGVLVGVDTSSGTTQQVDPTFGYSVLNIGGVLISNTERRLFKGDIDEVSVWNGVLSASDVQNLMYQTPPPATSASLAAFYGMSDGTGTSLTNDNGDTAKNGTLKDGRLPNIPPTGDLPLWVDSTAFGPSVTINQASGQADPTNVSTINFTVIFSQSVNGFETGDVDLSASTAPGPLSAVVTGSGTTYNVAVSGMSGSGTVVASILPEVATNASGFDNGPSISTDNTVNYDITGPTVTINQAPTQNDPTNTSPINFQVVFNETVTGFAAADINLTASTTPGSLSPVVTGSGTTYNVAVSGMTGSGTVIASIPAGAVIDGLGNSSSASTSTDNEVSYDTIAPTVTINQAPGQGDPTNSSPVNFQVIFSETVTDFGATDVNLTASTTPGTLSPVVTGSGTTYNVAVSGMTGNGTVIATIPAGGAHDAAGNANTAGTFSDNQVSYDNTAPTVTINQAPSQDDPAVSAPVNFQVIFSETVTGFGAADVNLATSTTPGTLSSVVTGSGTTYNVAVSGMTGSGIVIATVPAGAANDTAGNTSTSSTSSDNQVTYDASPLTVSINQAPGQLDPTNASPIQFQVVFSRSVTDFAGADVNLAASTTPGTLTPLVTGSGTTYTVSVSGMTGNGDVIASIPAGAAHDTGGNPNSASTSSDNSVSYDNTAPTVTVNPAPGQADPTNTSPVNFRVVFSETVTDFTQADVSLAASTAPGTLSALVTGSGTTYNVAVSGMSGDGLVTITIAAGVAHDAANNGNSAATGDNSVIYDASAPTVTINQAPGQTDPTVFSPITFQVVFSEAVTGFTTGDVNLSGTALGTLTAIVSGSGATYTVSVSGMTGSGTVIASIFAGVAQDAVGNTNSASTSSDPSVTYSHLLNKVYLPLATKP